MAERASGGAASLRRKFKFKAAGSAGLPPGIRRNRGKAIGAEVRATEDRAAEDGGRMTKTEGYPAERDFAGLRGRKSRRRGVEESRARS